jgi:aminoglycoside phosphotransferase (APT) family kinase protein
MSGARKKRLSIDEMSARLVEFVASEEGVPEADVRVRDLRPLAGGSSRLLFSVDVEIGSQPTLELVLRQDPPGRIQEGGMALEFELLRAAAERGVPVPRVHWCAPGKEPLGAPFFAMERLRGEAIPRRLLRDDRYADTREAMRKQLGAILARVHTIDHSAPALADSLQRPPEGQSAAACEIEKLAGGYRLLAVEPHPVLDLAERWLQRHLPADRPLGFVHGDYRIGNFMFDESGVVGVLDWELPHIGDPVEDLAWLCLRAWRFGNDDQEAGGVATREELVAAYEGAGGATVDLEALRFWEVLGNFKLALVFITQARAYLDGAHATVELASLGRRTAEGEAELLQLMEGSA